MAVPFRTRLFSRAFRVLDRAPVMQQPSERVRAAADRRDRLLALPAARLLTGRRVRGVDVVERTASVDGVALGLRVHRPAGTDRERLPVVMNFHGGGWVSGSPRQSEWWCASIAARARVAVVSVRYRLAPEHSFPTPVEDCYAATMWVADHAAEFGVDGSRLAVMGDSAGGNIAAVVAVLARDRGGPAIALQVLVYPAVDLVTEYASKTENADAPVLTARDVDNARELYLGTSDRSDPLASPLFAAHHDLPPALIQTAQYDPLRDQGGAYAVALRAAGVPVRLTNYADAVHGYISLPGVTVGADEALDEAVGEVRAALRAPVAEAEIPRNDGAR